MKAAAPVEIYNRLTGRVENETVVAEGALRWAYETNLGRMAVDLWLSRPWMSRLYGWWVSQPASRKKIRPFMERYGIDGDEMLERWDAMPNFNAFFMRRLKPEARPVDADPSAVVFPADGRHLLIPRINGMDRLYRKGERLDTEALLGGLAGGERFREGAALVSRLSPLDYHRFHFPLHGAWRPPVPLEGRLYSVHPIALLRRTAALWRNRRFISSWEHPQAGAVAMVEIGATMVGSIQYTFTGKPHFQKGEEKGYFAFGGSCIVTLFENPQIRFEPDLLEHSAAGREVLARMGDRAAVLPAHELPPTGR